MKNPMLPTPRHHCIRDVFNRGPDETSEEGSVLPLYLSLLLICVIAATMLVVLIQFFTVRQADVNDLSTTRERMTTQYVQAGWKNSPDPERFIAESVIDSLRENGNVGKIEVVVAETPTSSLGKYSDNYRVISWYAVCSSDTEGSKMNMTATSSIGDTYIAYSNSTIWRPTEIPLYLTVVSESPGATLDVSSGIKTENVGACKTYISDGHAKALEKIKQEQGDN